MLKYLIPVLFLSSAAIAQEASNITFENPLNISINASGNFGELRGSHFHTGIDIKTQQRIGLPVYAPADGYVSRIKVSTWGYGKALYIDHPNGMTTVYGHLNAYEGDIKKKVFDSHYKEQKFEIEIFLKKGELPVKKGDIIAYTGNTGGSGGPHLHYEFRDTKTQNIINPLQLGLDKMLVDNQAPSLNTILVYPLSSDAVVNKSELPLLLSTTTLPNGELTTEKIEAKGKIGFGIDIYDTANFNNNKNGVYLLQTTLNGKKLFGYTFNQFSFAETGFVNALVDYDRMKKTKQKVQKLFVTKAYPLSTLTIDQASKGTIDVKPGESYNYQIELKDYHGNTKRIIIPIEFKNETATIRKKEANGNYDIDSDREFIYEKENISVTIPAKTFYNDFKINLNVKDNILTLHQDTEAVVKSIAIAFNTEKMALANPDKSFIARTDGNNRSYYKTYKKGAIYTAYVKSLGQYEIRTDEEAPQIFNPSFTEGQWLSNVESISFKVKDNLSGINTIEGFINDKWILLDYDYKTNKIEHSFKDGIVNSGKNDVVIKVTDQVGNETQFKSHFFRK